MEWINGLQAFAYTKPDVALKEIKILQGQNHRLA